MSRRYQILAAAAATVLAGTHAHATTIVPLPDANWGLTVTGKTRVSSPGSLSNAFSGPPGSVSATAAGGGGSSPTVVAKANGVVGPPDDGPGMRAFDADSALFFEWEVVGPIDLPVKVDVFSGGRFVSDGFASAVVDISVGVYGGPSLFRQIGTRIPDDGLETGSFTLNTIVDVTPDRANSVDMEASVTAGYNNCGIGCSGLSGHAFGTVDPLLQIDPSFAGLGYSIVFSDNVLNAPPLHVSEPSTGVLLLAGLAALWRSRPRHCPTNAATPSSGAITGGNR